MKFGEEVRLKRRIREMTQQELARRARTTQGTVSSLERGAVVSQALAQRIARVLNISIKTNDARRGD